MNIRAELLKEKIHTREHAMQITGYATLSKDNFKELMQCFLSNEYRLAQRAAWSVSRVAKQQPELIFPYVKDIVAQLSRTDVHNAVIRNSIRILEDIDIPQTFHGEVLNTCFQFIEDPSTPVAIKAFSLTVIFKLSKIYLEIKNELKLIIEERWDDETAAFRSRGRKILQHIS